MTHDISLLGGVDRLSKCAERSLNLCLGSHCGCCLNAGGSLCYASTLILAEVGSMLEDIRVFGNIISYCSSTFCLAGQSTVEGGIYHVVFFCTQVEDACVAHRCPVALAVGIVRSSLVLESECQLTICYLGYKHILKAARIEGNGTAMYTPDDITQCVKCNLVSDGLVGNRTRDVAVHTIFCLILADHLFYYCRSINLGIVGIDDSRIVGAGGITCGTEGGIDAYLIITILQAGQSLVDIEDSLLIAELTCRHTIVSAE